MTPVRAVISDFGGVLTTPLLHSFAAFQDHSGVPMEALGRGLQTVAERDGANPLYELEKGRMTEADFLRSSATRSRRSSAGPSRWRASPRSTSPSCRPTRR